MTSAPADSEHTVSVSPVDRQSAPPIALDIFEIRDPDIDPEQIMAEIRARIERRRAELGYEQRTFPTFGAAAYPGEPKDIPFDEDLHHYLRLANESYSEVETDAVLLDSPSTQLPVAGPLWKNVRRAAHDLVLFYVNRSIAHQTNINSYLVSVLNRLTTVVEEQQRTIDRLESEVQDLRKKD